MRGKRISKAALVKFIGDNLTVYMNDRKQFVKLARATFGYSDKTCNEDILLSLNRAWKECCKHG